MNKILLLLSIASCSGAALAETDAATLSGSIANSWTQAGVRATDKPFDLAIQGNGFFAIRLPSGEEAFSRYGEMSVDWRGFLVHAPTRGEVLGYCDGEIGPIDLSRFARDEGDKSFAKSFRIELNGTIVAVYENGYSRETCRVAIALFRNSPMLKRSLSHTLHVTGDSGQGSLGVPQVEGRGSIYGSSLEELDEQM
jgi:flagellar hook protein FlgE